MAATVNGYIAREDGETPWSKEEWQNFSKMVKSARNLVIGRKTYEAMKENDEFSKIGNPFMVIVSSKSLGPGVTTVGSPKEALRMLKKEKYETALVAGGGKLNSSFLKEKLVDEIYLDIEPLIFGKGIRLFSEDDLDAKLELLGTKSISQNTVQLHYAVLK